MRVLIVGATGKFGSRLIPALMASNHTPIAFVRTRTRLESMLPASLLSNLTIVTGDAESIPDVKRAIIENECDVLVCCAGAPAPMRGQDKGKPSRQGIISKQVILAAVQAGEETGKVIRGWWVAGFALMDEPGRGGRIFADEAPSFRPEHRVTVSTLFSTPLSSLQWSILCPAAMPVRSTSVLPNQGVPERTLMMHHTTSSLPFPWWNLARLLLNLPGMLRMLGLALLARIRMSVPMEDVCGMLAEEIAREEWVGKRVGFRQVWQFC